MFYKIIIFISQSTLLPYLSKQHPTFSLSDIVVLGAGRFLVSNVFRWSNRWLQLAEFVTQREYGCLLMYDGKQVHTLVRYDFINVQTPSFPKQPTEMSTNVRKQAIYLTNLVAYKRRMVSFGSLRHAVFS